MQTTGKTHALSIGIGAGTVIGIAVAAVLALTPRPDAPAGEAADLTVNGAGASFPYPLYSKWISEYEDVEPGIRINYSPIGSGGGIRQITTGTVDFAGSDAPMKDSELAAAPAEIVHIPTVIGTVALAYHLDLDGRLRLTPDVLAAIFLGNITEWDDPRIREINPNLELPNNPIVVARRADSSGTTFIFTDYLAAVSPEWARTVGAAKQPEWPSPNNIGGKGNPGVAGLIQQIPGAIGYVELAYAVENGLPTVLLQNKAGNFVEANLETTTAAAAGAIDEIPADYRVSLVNSDGENAYPIAGFTYLLLYRDQADYRTGKAVVDFIRWALHEGQAYTSELLYAPLPDMLVDRLEGTLKEITYQGEPILQ